MDDGTMASTNEAMELIRAADADPRGTVLMLLRVLGSGLATATRERDEARAENERLHAIIAPGELTRAELRAQAFREGAEAMREAIAKFYEARAAFLDTLCVDAIVDDESEDYGRFCEAIDAPPTVRNIPVPPCPEVSR